VSIDNPEGPVEKPNAPTERDIAAKDKGDGQERPQPEKTDVNHPCCKPKERKRWKYAKRTISVLTLFFVGWYTVTTTRILSTSQKQVGEAIKQTAAAKRQADAVSRSQIFVTLSGGDTVAAWTFDDDKDMLVKVHLTNYGASPAIIQRVGCVITWGDNAGPPAAAIQMADTDPGSAASGIDPDTIIESKGNPVGECRQHWPLQSPLNLKEVPKRDEVHLRHPLWVIAYIRYVDADPAGGPHLTAICGKYDGWNGKGPSAPFTISNGPGCAIHE
jgi:hypothetical protein